MLDAGKARWATVQHFSSRHSRYAMVSRPRLLFIHPGPVPPDSDANKNTLFHLSVAFEGDLISTWWEPDRDRARDELPLLNRALGSFGYHPTRSTRLPGVIRAAWNFFFFVGKGMALARRGNGYDAIVAYGPFTTGLAAYVLKLLLGAKLVVDVPGHLWRGFGFHPGFINRVKMFVAKRLAPFVLRRADAIKLLYPQQLEGVELPQRAIVRVFHDLVPLSALPSTETEIAKPYILFLGYPWHLKGVDVLIKAFLLVANRFPGYTLKVVGHCPDRGPYERLAEGHPRIELHRAVPHSDAMRLMAGCSLFVLPSRTEGMGKVLLEAMAMGKPVVASRVDGIPHYVQHEETGLLFESENPGDLARQLVRLLEDPKYRQRIAANGRHYTLAHLSERSFAEQFGELIRATVSGGVQGCSPEITAGVRHLA